MEKGTAAVPVVDNQNITASEFTYETFGYIQNLVLSDWRWRVRAYVGGVWQDWTPERSFDVEPPTPRLIRRLGILIGMNVQERHSIICMSKNLVRSIL